MPNQTLGLQSVRGFRIRVTDFHGAQISGLCGRTSSYYISFPFYTSTYQVDSSVSLGYLGYFASRIELISLVVLHGYANCHTVYSLIEDPEVLMIND